MDGIINVAGVDDEIGNQVKSPLSKPAVHYPSDEEAILSSLPQNLFTIFLKHRPTVTQSCRHLFDLQLSGHTHGGQIFPFTEIIPILYPSRPGLHKLSRQSFLYTNSGAGTWGPPMRFLAPPKIAVIELVNNQRSGTD
ncbi:MAG: hypothetical protein K6U11_08825 [bacterium]|nr:hypothetical protein [bacterium]